MRKILIAVAAVFGSGLAVCQAGELEGLKASSPDLSSIRASYFQQAGAELPVPQAFTPGPVIEAAAPVAGDDALLDSLSDAQWNDILNSEPWEADGPAASKELFGDFHTRYIVKGRISFKTDPPVFTAETGKVFIVTKYPGWLKEVGDAKICVEGYARQRDNTAEFVIKKMLPPSALDGIMPAAEMQNLQRDPAILARNAEGYVLGNVNWNLAHNPGGARKKDEYGNFISEWQSGVVVKPELLEAAYFVKKTTLKPIRYGDHGLLLFKFRPGGVMAPGGKTTRYLVVSLDAYYKDKSNMSYSPVAALKGKYLVYYSIQTIERYSEVKLAEDPQSMTMYPLALTLGQQRLLLDNSFRKATDNNKGEAYSLFYNSCANSALSLINGVLEDGKKIKAGWLPEIVYRLRTTLPDSIAALLLKKGIVSKPLPEITVNNYRQVYGI